MSGHGHVIPNADGMKARCGGPGICPECARELALQQNLGRPDPTLSAAELCRALEEWKDAGGSVTSVVYWIGKLIERGKG
jgi:hypothetical protein